MVLFCDGVAINATVDEAMEFLAKRRERQLSEPIQYQPFKVTAATPPGFQAVPGPLQYPPGVRGGDIKLGDPVPGGMVVLNPTPGLTVADPNIKLTFNEELGKQLVFPLMPAPENPHFETPYEVPQTHNGASPWPGLRVGGPQDPTGGKTFK